MWLNLVCSADYTTTFTRDDSSAISLFSLLEKLGSFSGLKINKTKTEGLWLGSWKSRLGNDEPFGISWPKQYVSTFGVSVRLRKRRWWQNQLWWKASILKKVLSLWSGRHLTILGRLAIIKTLALSKLVTLTGPIAKGGLNIILIKINILLKFLNLQVISKVGWVWSSGWTKSWINQPLLLTVTDVSTTCAVVIFRVKVSCITSVDGIILWLLIRLVNYVAILIVVCQLSGDVIGYEQS